MLISGEEPWRAASPASEAWSIRSHQRAPASTRAVPLAASSSTAFIRSSLSSIVSSTDAERGDVVARALRSDPQARVAGGGDDRRGLGRRAGVAIASGRWS